MSLQDKIIGKLKTHGAKIGEFRDILRSRLLQTINKMTTELVE